MKKVAILCSGLDGVMRGYETHTRLLYDELAKENCEKNHVILYKRSGQRLKNEIVLCAPARTSFIVGILSRIRGDELYWEYLFFAIRFLIHCIIKNNIFDKILVIEPMVAKTLMKFKTLLPGSPVIVFTHGVWIEPEEYAEMGDVFHQPNIENYHKQKKYFLSNSIDKPSYLIPHFILEKNLSGGSSVSKNGLRKKYNIQTKYVLLSVGVINRSHKNMEYLINEASKLPNDWTLMLCGRVDEFDLITKAKDILGDRFISIYVNRGEVDEIYQLADLFVLASKQEGFGIVILEAMRAGLPIVLHDRELFRWILKDKNNCIRMDQDGALSKYIINKNKNNPSWFLLEGKKNLELFKAQYTWVTLKKQYMDMLFG